MSPTGTNDSGTNGPGPSALSNAISRRHVLQLFGIAGVGVAGIGSLEACSPSQPSSEGNKSASKEFHGAYPYQLPPKGHFNLAAGVTDGIQQQSPYLDLIYPSGGILLGGQEVGIHDGRVQRAGLGRQELHDEAPVRPDLE